MREFFQLLWLKFIVTIRNSIEFVQVIGKYYPNRNFRRCDLALLRSYLFRNPFQISKRYLLNKGAEDPYLYGETPLTTLQNIVKECQLKKSDVIYELGCGRGRTCFWLNAFLGCQVIGIEQIPEFVKKAKLVKKKYNIEGIEFLEGDILTMDYYKATVIYLYGTSYEDNFIESLIQKLSLLPAGTKIITVSYPLTDYTIDPSFELIHTFPADFTWGEASVFLQVRK